MIQEKIIGLKKEIIDCEKSALNTLILSLYKMISKSAVTMAYTIAGDESIEYTPSLSKMKKSLQSYEDKLRYICKSLTSDMVCDNKQMSEYIDTYTQARMATAEFVKKYIEVIQKAIERENSAIENIPDLNSQITKILRSMKKDLSGWVDFGENFESWLEQIIFTFELSVELINIDFGMLNNELAKQRAIKKEKEMAVSKEPKKEDSRSKAIKDAKNLYNMFCLDFMRDLEKQYAFSSKDLYEDFVNRKFKRFIQKFSWLTSDNCCDVSEGEAKEAYSQIMNMINKVSEISANSYQITPFSN